MPGEKFPFKLYGYVILGTYIMTPDFFRHPYCYFTLLLSFSVDIRTILLQHSPLPINYPTPSFPRLPLQITFALLFSLIYIPSSCCW